MPRSFKLSPSLRFPIHNLPIAPHSAVLRLYNVAQLTLILLTWNIGWAPNNASKWQMGFNLAFKGLNLSYCQVFGTDVTTAYFFLFFMCQWSLWTGRVHTTRSIWCKSTSLAKVWIYLHSLWRVDRGSDYFCISLNRKKRYSSTLSLTLEVDRVGGQRHTPAALPPGKTRYPLYRRLGGP
jgi:hypothetical protein